MHRQVVTNTGRPHDKQKSTAKLFSILKRIGEIEMEKKKEK